MAKVPFCISVATGFKRQLQELGTIIGPAVMRLCGCIEDTLIMIVEPMANSYQGTLFGMVVRAGELTPTWSDDPYELGKDLAESSVSEGGIYRVPIWELNSEYIHWDRNGAQLALEGLVPLKSADLEAFQWPTEFMQI